MEAIGEILENIKESICHRTEQSGQKEKSTTQTSYECDKCKDLGYIIDSETNTAKICECTERKQYQRILERSGISDKFKRISFKEFETKIEWQKTAKGMAISYVKKFEDIEKQRNNSIAFLGNCGAGKTHLSIAIANNLMSKNIAVLYMPYREAITHIKQIVTDDEAYNKEISRYKNARVLLIDDFAKRKNNRK